MAQLWKLVLLCGLLNGISASLLGDLSGSLSNVDNLKPVVSSGDSTLEGTLQNLNNNLESLQKSEAFQTAKQQLLNVGNLLDNTFSNYLGLKIINVNFQTIKLNLNTDGKSLQLTIPVAANVSMNLPIVGQVTNVAVSGDLKATLGIEFDSQTNLFTLKVESCSIDSSQISVSLLNRDIKAVNVVFNSLVKVLQTLLTTVLQRDVCPFTQIITNALNVNSVQTLINSLSQNTAVPLNL